MKRILFFIIRKKLTETVLSESEGRYKFFTYSLIILCVSFFTGFFLARYYDLNIEEQVVNADVFLLFVNSFFAINFLLLDFYPVYKINPFLFPNFYPIKKYSKAFIVLLVYCLNYYSMLVVLMYVQLAFLSAYFGIKEFVFSLLFVFCGYLINRIIKNVTEYVVPGGKIILLTTLLSVAGYVSYLYFLSFSAILDAIFLILFFGILITLFTYAESDKKVKFGSHSIFVLPIKNFYGHILSNHNISSAYLYGFFYKILLLAGAVLTLQSANELPDTHSSVWILASPIIVYLYLGLNFFGYNRNLFFTHIIREWQVNNLAVTYFKSMGILLLIDGLIFWAFVLITDLYQWEIVLSYYTAAIVLLIICFWFALYRPVFKNSFSMLDFSFISNKGGINLWGVSALILLLFIIDEIKYSNYQLVISAILLLAVLTGIRFYRYNFPSIAYNAYQQMRKFE